MQSEAGRFARSCAAAIAICGAAFAWLVTDGTFNFLQSAPFSNFYDAQARSLLRGTWSMPANILTIEGIRTGSRTDMYYGPVPAFLRIPVLVFTHRLDGRLTQPSLLIGFLLALTFVALLCWRIRGMVRGPADLRRSECLLTAALIVVIGLGSILFFLGSTAQVYEEAEMWGAAFTLGAFFSLLGFLERPVVGRLVSTGVFATLAMLTRGSVGAGPLVALALVASVYLLAWSATRLERLEPTARRTVRTLGVRLTDRPGRFSIGLIAATAVPLALYAAVNDVKFGSLFNIPVTRQVFSMENAHRQAVLASNGGSLFGLKFLPTNVLQFVRPDALAVTRLFPWLFFPGKALVLGNVLYDSRDWTSSVTACMPVLFILAVVGIVKVYKPGSGSRTDTRTDTGTGTVSEAPGVATLRLPLVGAAAGTYGILTIAFIAQRYLADAMPFLLLAGLVGWHVVIRRVATIAPVARAVGAVLLVVLALFGLWATFSLSLFYQRELGPLVSIPQRAGMVAFQQQIDRSLFGGPASGVLFVSGLPASAPPLTLAVVGKCNAVYQFDGNLWQPVELGAGGGAVRLQVTFSPRDLGERQLLLVTGRSTPQDVVAVTWEGGDLFSFSYIFDQKLPGATSLAWYQEQAVVVAPGQHQVQVDLVTQLGMVFVTMDGNPVFSLLYPVAPPAAVRLGSADPAVSSTTMFAGSVRSIPVPTPICHALEQRRAASNAVPSR